MNNPPFIRTRTRTVPVRVYQQLLLHVRTRERRKINRLQAENTRLRQDLADAYALAAHLQDQLAQAALGDGYWKTKYRTAKYDRDILASQLEKQTLELAAARARADCLLAELAGNLETIAQDITRIAIMTIPQEKQS